MLLLGANRDESLARPAMPPHVVVRQPRIVAGRDSRAGGTWLGIQDQDMVAALLNRQVPESAEGRWATGAEPDRSRGLLCLDALRMNGTDSAAELGGVLAVGVTSLVAGYYLSELFSRFRRTCPAVEVFVTEDTPRFLEHLLINGELDVAIMVSNALSEPQAMVAETLTRSPNRVWLAANHPLTARDELTLAELYEACNLRIPIAEAVLPCRDDALGRSAISVLDELRIPLRELLKRRASTIHSEEG
jgi:hypothetical protein